MQVPYQLEPYHPAFSLTGATQQLRPWDYPHSDCDSALQNVACCQDLRLEAAGGFIVQTCVCYCLFNCLAEGHQVTVTVIGVLFHG